MKSERLLWIEDTVKSLNEDNTRIQGFLIGCCGCTYFHIDSCNICICDGGIELYRGSKLYN